jgi:hypothetical protein
MPTAGHLIRIIDIYPPQMGGKRTIMHRTRTLDYAVVIEGEVVLILEDSEVLLSKSDVVVQRGTNHAWENRSDKMARMVFFHMDAQFSDELLANLPTPDDLRCYSVKPRRLLLKGARPVRPHFPGFS